MVILNGVLKKSTDSAQAFLHCELGLFVVRDDRLESLSIGNHDGFFEINTIQPHLLPSKDGAMGLGLIAELQRFSLAVKDQTKKPAAKANQPFSQPSAPCSLFEEEEILSLEQETEGVEAKAAISIEPLSEEIAKADQIATAAALFGMNYRLAETIALDVTEPRELLRQKRDCLKNIGYRFNAERQLWQRPTIN